MRIKIRPRGFTLVELLIVVAIIGILAAIVYPSYQDSVRKSRRADAKAVMAEAAQFMERFYTENFCYSNRRTAAGCAGAAVALPVALQASPKEGTLKFYNITLTGLGATTFTLNAAPAGVQSSDVCGTLTLTNTGLRGVTGSESVTECWR